MKQNTLIATYVTYTAVHFKSIIDQAMGMNFFCHHFTPTGTFWHISVQTVYESWTYCTFMLLCVPFLLADNARCLICYGMLWLSYTFVMQSSIIIF